MIKFPTPPSWILNTSIQIIAELDGEDGVEEKVIFDGRAYYEEGVRRVVNENKQIVELSGLAIVYDNIVFDKAFVKIDGKERVIYKTSRPKNPDGSVYSTEMELI